MATSFFRDMSSRISTREAADHTIRKMTGVVTLTNQIVTTSPLICKPRRGMIRPAPFVDRREGRLSTAAADLQTMREISHRQSGFACGPIGDLVGLSFRRDSRHRVRLVAADRIPAAEFLGHGGTRASLRVGALLLIEGAALISWACHLQSRLSSFSELPAVIAGVGFSDSLH